ncbi:MAG: accessory Sec system protein Asp2 [Lachnospiraceae bacterium]|nr:accessory Sec system protein Asp2 [Lachnospiraceae bacterium]
MSKEIKVLQLGAKDWREIYNIPSNLDYDFFEEFNKEKSSFYDIAFIDKELSDEEIKILYEVVKSYTLFVLDDIFMSKSMKLFFNHRRGRLISQRDIQGFFDTEIKNFFSEPYGEKFDFKNMSVAERFKGTVSWNGNYSVDLEGNFGKDFNQIALWRNNLPLYPGQALELWLEYKKDPQVELALSVTQFVAGSVSDVQQSWYFTQEELDKEMIIDNENNSGMIFISLYAKGKGNLSIIALHDRHSRRGYGTFIPGGKRYATSKREEIFYYFDPGNAKPPLNVYFSGYKTRQGFEGYNMLKKMGCPFLLIGEPRLEGGSFYMGDKEYERAMANIIKSHLKKLKFDNDQLILAGISMGSFGALYYGCDLLPHAILVGKPLVNVGDIAFNERISRPGGFPTSLDVINYVSDEWGQDAVDIANKRFWDKFSQTKWGGTKLVVSYMIEDDYDSKAYDMLISHLKSSKMQICGKGIHGRHNDASGDIVAWFKAQYDQILYEDFGIRKK